MEIRKRNFLTRKDLAQILEVSVQSLYRNEQRLGLDKARCDFNERMVRFNFNIAQRELRMRNLWP